MSDHHIVKGTERNGFCDRCGLAGDLTFMSCKRSLSMIQIIEKKILEGDYKKIGEQDKET